MNPIVKKILKVFAWILGSIIFLIILVLILIQIPAVQNYAKNKAVAYLEKKLKTKVVIDNLSISFPKEVVLKGVYFEDQKKDTLLYGREIRVDIALFKLLKSEVDVNYLELNGIKTHMYRIQPDTAFNFDYIVKAFASTDTVAKPVDTTGGMKFNLNQIVFKDILATYKDDKNGNDIYFYLGKFETKVKTFDPDKLVYDVSNIKLSGINARIHQYTPAFTKKVDSIAKAANVAVATKSPSIKLGELALQNVHFAYIDDVSASSADINIGDLITHPTGINTQTLAIQLNDLTLKNTKADVTINKPTQTANAPANTTSADTLQAPAWNFTVNKMVFDNEDITYNDNTQPKTKKGMDYSHIHIQGLQFNAVGLVLTPTSYTGDIQQLAFKEQSGFSLQKLQTKFYYSDTGAYLNNLYVEAGRTVVKDKIIVRYSSLKSISTHVGNIYLSADLKNSSIDTKDILTFAPQLEGSLKGNEKTLLHLNTSIRGYVKNLSIPVFQLSGIGSTYVDLSGKIQGLPGAGTAYYDINIAQLRITAADINALVPKSAIPTNVRIPASLSARGYFKGNVKQLETQLQLISSSGNAFVKGTMHNNAYVADVTLAKFNVGYVTKQDSAIGIVTLTAKAKGNGFDLKSAVADIEAKVQSAELKGYTYKNLTLTGSAGHGIGNIKANMQDENVRFDLAANADLTTAYPSNLKMQLQLDTVNFNALHLMKDTLSLHGMLNADLPSTNPDSLIGRVSLAGFSVTTPQRTLNPDSLIITADANGQQRDLNINSPFLKADLNGAYRFTEMGQALEQTINQYYNIAGYQEKTFVAEDWHLDATFIPSAFILQLLSGVKGTDSIAIHAAFNSANRDLNASLKTKRVIYNGNQADSVNLLVNTANNRLNFNASVQDAKGGGLSTYHTVVGGFVADNKIDVSLDVNDQKNKTQYNIAGVLQQITQGIKFTLHPDGLVLNYDKWNVAGDNYIQYDSSGLIINNFNISNANQSLSINSQTKSANAPLDVKFNNFKISTLTRIANQDSLLLAGSINGNAVVKNVATNPVFTSDLTIDSVVYKKDTIGTVAIKVNNEQANAFAANVSIVGNNNDIRLNGIFHPDGGEMDFKLVMSKFDLATIEPLAKDQITDAGGSLTANIAIKGTIDKPAITGIMNFDNATITPAISGETFKLSHEFLIIDDKGLHFDNFTIYDSADSKAVITGDVLTTDFKRFTFKTSVDARNFTIINTPKASNKTFYGRLDISTHLKIIGPQTGLEATGTLKLNPTTNFVYVHQDNDPSIQEREGVVQFVDAKHPDTAGIKPQYDTTATSTLRGLDIDVNIETDSLAKLTLIVDPSTGDALTVQGIANLNGGVDRSGKITLTGNYQLTQGAYQVSISALKRRFIIQNGSTIIWTGDPTLAQINIKAIYYANVPSIDLVQQQIIGPDLTRFKQVLPFQAELKLEGDLLKPTIAFDITLPEELLAQWPDVDLRLQQVRIDPSELNKQVFALLLLGRFLQEDPFASGGGGTTAEDIAVQSVSRILADQLNEFAATLVKGVDINFSIISAQDYSTGTQQTYTDVNVGASKKLLSDRLLINVGTDIGLQGPANTPAQVQNTNVTGNFAVDYRLTKDGRYRVRVYRQNDYQEIIEGQVVETGTSFILTMDYDRFRELFHKKSKSDQTQFNSTNGIDHTKVLDKNKKNTNGAPPANVPQQP